MHDDRHEDVNASKGTRWTLTHKARVGTSETHCQDKENDHCLLLQKKEILTDKSEGQNQDQVNVDVHEITEVGFVLKIEVKI